VATRRSVCIHEPDELSQWYGHNHSTINIIVVVVVVVVVKPHRSTTYVYAAYSYRPSSVVCRSVTLVSPVKTVAPIELPSGFRTCVGPGNHVLDGGSRSPMGRGKFWGENERPIVKYRDTLRPSVQGRLNR